MNVTATESPSSFTDTPSGSASSSSGDTIIAKDNARPVRGAANAPSPWRPILETYGREILEYASDTFLDLAIARRLGTINARDLVNLLARTGRLGYKANEWRLSYGLL